MSEAETLAARVRQAVQGCTVHIHGPVQAWKAVEDAARDGRVERGAVGAIVLRDCEARLVQLGKDGVTADDPRVLREQTTQRFVERLFEVTPEMLEVDHGPSAFCQSLLDAVATDRARLVEHPIYTSLTTIEQVRRFMEHHVYAVWDFMALLKALQRHVTCIDVPWVPKGDAHVRRFINEIVVAEESDRVGGRIMSHFEMYVAAMRDAGAETRSVERFLVAIRQGHLIHTALEAGDVPEPSARFVLHTLDVVNRGRAHEIAAVFAIGRENLIPAMFLRIIRGLEHPELLGSFIQYLERHVEIDGGLHGGLSNRMLESLCESSPEKWREATLAAGSALRERAKLWDGVMRG